jgi:diguanylate cyclase (GGDEF)-like protein
MSAQQRHYIVCVDDEESVLEVLREQIYCNFGDRLNVEIAACGKEALAVIEDIVGAGERVAILVADHFMPGLKGADLLEQVHALHPDIKKVLLTGQAGLDSVVKAINFGGLDYYLSKPWNESQLKNTLENLLKQYTLERENACLLKILKEKNRELSALNEKLGALVRQRTEELERANARLERLAITDGLTDLYNYRHFRERLEHEIKRAQRSDETVSLLMADVDRFKNYNDHNGHLAGDKALKKIAYLLKQGRRAADVVSRYGGEEFTVVLVGAPKRSAVHVAEYLRKRIEDTHFEGEEHQPSGELTISVGVAAYPEDAETGDELLMAADRALYAAKNKGRNRVTAYHASVAEGPTMHPAHRESPD